MDLDLREVPLTLHLAASSLPPLLPSDTWPNIQDRENHKQLNGWVGMHRGAKFSWLRFWMVPIQVNLSSKPGSTG